ncbi:hypothetical protein RclHR1_07130011 [Rhizophagus clarus]|uniref:Crinkler effector protein N-terminal domain-containing protein n=1 Tax=Rhizophagus clarus TaxID=94130 RepID=A0A2Z6SC31_9GLOM|nr:hypothetical protein RclHR1_07130011 [Rhizophagus clarus]
MSTIRLMYLLREELPENAFEIEVENNESIYNLKKYISKKVPDEFIGTEFIDFDFNELIPWKVNISVNEKIKLDKLRTHPLLSVKEILNDKEMNNKTSNVDYYFSDDMLLCKKFINIIVE